MKLTIKRTLKIMSYLLVFSILAIAVVTVLSVMGIPKNAQIYVVETGSMSPEIPQGSIAFVSPQDSYQIGDVITYKSNLGEIGPKEINVTHRISGVMEEDGDTFYETKGDANTGKDPWTANSIDVIGKVNFHLPLIGYIVGFAKTKIGFLFLILIPAILIIMLELMNVMKVLNENKEKKKTHSGRRSFNRFELAQSV